MIAPISQIAGALGTAAGSLLPSAPATAAATQAAGTDFSQVLAQLTSRAVDTIRQGEAMSIGGIEGKIPVQQVVESITSAEQTLQTVIAVRDKVVAAYQQVSQMAI